MVEPDGKIENCPFMNQICAICAILLPTGDVLWDCNSTRHCKENDFSHHFCSKPLVSVHSAVVTCEESMFNKEKKIKNQFDLKDVNNLINKSPKMK